MNHCDFVNNSCSVMTDIDCKNNKDVSTTGVDAKINLFLEKFVLFAYFQNIKDFHLKSYTANF